MKRLFETKPVLDEREMQEMYRVEHAGLWMMVGLLFIAVIVQLLTGAGLLQMAGELAVLIAGSVFMIAAYVRRGIWDEHSRPSLSGNAAYAAVSALGVALLVFARRRAWGIAAIAGICMFAACFALLTIFMNIIKKRQQAREKALDDD